MNWIVIKFGGSSQSKLGFDTIIRRIYELRKDNYSIVIVLSAIKGITNLLVQLANVSIGNDSSESIIEEIIRVNNQLVIDCGLNCNIIESIINRLIYLQTKHDHQSKIDLISNGEILSTIILYYYLESLNIKSQLFNSAKFVSSKTDYNNTVDYCLSSEYFFKSDQFFKEVNCPIVICQGFLGSTPSNNICLLGRGGSDTSGSIIAAGINADRLEIWTDVDGMYSADPNKIKSAQIIENINYNVAQELAAMGAKVLHPYCILPCQAKNIPITIRNTYNYDSSKITTISNQNLTKLSFPIYAITDQHKITIFTIKSLDMWNHYGFVCDIFKVFSEFNVDVNIITTSQFTISTTTNETDFVKLEALKKKLDETYSVIVMHNCSIISIVSEQILKQSEIDAALKIARYQHEIEIIHYSANQLTISLVVQHHESIKLLNTLHDKLIHVPTIHKPPKDKWWSHPCIRSQIINIYTKENMYLYNLAYIEHKISQLKQDLPVIDSIVYAMKANNHPEVLNVMDSKLEGFECVSIDEIIYLRECLSITSVIIFTPNFCHIDEYLTAMKYQDVIIILDNVDILTTRAEDFVNQSIGLRLNLNDSSIESGHHKNVITQGKKAKFGSSCDKILEFLHIFSKYNIKIVGLHSHRGSGIHDYRSWVQTAKKLVEFSSSFPDTEWINLGGGFVVMEQIDWNQLNTELISIKPQHLKFIIEPGRLLVADCGILISRVTQLKTKDDIQFLGISTGMNSLIRPCLYNAYHPIYNYSKINDVCDTKYNVVGPICETGDFLGFNCLLPKSEVKDIILIDQTGAYGKVMSSKYNMRKSADEYTCYIDI